MKADQQQPDSDSSDDLEQSEIQRRPLTLAARTALTLAIIVHLLAVALPPLAFQASGPLGSSPSVGMLLRSVEPYSQFTYMNRGYAFFAPDPGPSHLIQAAIFEPSGSRTEVMFPDLKAQWPRLLYHRHFMLAEYLTTIYTPKGPPQELIEEDREAAFAWEQARGRYENVRQSITDHLKHVNDGKHVVIRRIEHAIPSFIEFINEQIDLSDPELYIVLLDLSPETPMGPPEAIPVPITSETDPAQDLQAPQQPSDDDSVSASDDTESSKNQSDSNVEPDPPDAKQDGPPRDVEAQQDSGEQQGVSSDDSADEIKPAETDSEAQLDSEDDPSSEDAT